MILDINSRYAVGWILAQAERAELSKRLINDMILKQGVTKDQFTQTEGYPMIAKRGAHFLADLTGRDQISEPAPPQS